LKQLNIEGFRGINNQGEPLVLSFKTDQVNSVFGANALGKSSTFEAISYAIKREVRKLEELPASEGGSDYYVNRFHGTGTSTIGLLLAADDGTATIDVSVIRGSDGRRIVISPSGVANPDEFLRSLDSQLTLLDHDTFLKFVNDTPLKRGRTFSGLLGLSPLSEFRQVLETLSHRRSLNTDLELETLRGQLSRESAAVSELEENLTLAICKFFSKEHAGILDLEAIEDSVLTNLRSIPMVATAIPASSLGEVDFEAIKTAIKKAEASDKRDHLGEVLQELSLLNNLGPAQSEANELAHFQDALAKRTEALQLTRGSLFHELYSTVERMYQEEVWTAALQCPVCESSLLERLPDQVTQKLQQYKDVDEGLETIHQLWRSSSWQRRLKRFEQQAEIRSTTPSRDFTYWAAQFEGPNPSLEAFQQAVEQLREMEAARVRRLLQVQMEKAELERDLPPSLVALTERVELAANIQQCVRSLRTSTVKRAELAASINLRSDWMTFIEKVSDIFAGAEVRLSTAQTTALESDYRQMYEQITNNPEIVPLLHKSDSTEELHLRLARFYGLTGLSAATLLPESYRNALALCIYLSSALRSPSPARFMVLDDVTSSFDAGHQWALMELIRTKIAYPTNPDGPQVIILSHDGLLEKYFDTMATRTQWHHQKLQGLPPKGMVHPHAQTVDRLESTARKHLSNGHLDLAMPLIRQYLEQKLLQIIRKLDIPVPLDFSIRDDRKMVANCLDAISSAVALHRQAGDLVMKSQQVKDLETVYLPALVGNWVSHYPTMTGMSISPSVLLDVIDTINKISDSFVYPCSCNGGTRLRFYKTLAAKACNC
jgi:hypothetical protein